MDLWQNITEAVCTTFTRENGLHFLAECCQLAQRSTPLLAAHGYWLMTKKPKNTQRKVPYFQPTHTSHHLTAILFPFFPLVNIFRDVLSSAVVNVFAQLPGIFNAQFATAARPLSHPQSADLIGTVCVIASLKNTTHTIAAWVSASGFISPPPNQIILNPAGWHNPRDKALHSKVNVMFPWLS